MRFRYAAVAIASALALSTAARGSDANADDATATSAASVREASSSTAVGEPPSGEPIVIGAISTDEADQFSLPESADGLESWANYVNANGGIDGRPVEIERCNDEFTPEKNSGCARQLADDDRVLAVAGSTAPLNGTVALPILAEAGLPYVCANPLDVNEFLGETSFCISGGALGYVYIAQYLIDEEGATNVVFLGSDTPNSSRFADLIGGVAADAGVQFEYIPIPLGAPDYTPSVTQAASGDPDAIILAVDAVTMIRILETFDTLGITVPLAAYGATVTDEAVTSGSSAIDGMLVNADYPTWDQSDPEVAIFLEQMAADGHESSVNDFGIAGWVSGRVIEHAIRELGAENVTRESLNELLQGDGVSGVPLAPETMSLASAPALEGYDKLVNPTTFLGRVHEGEVVVVSERFEPALFTAR